MNHKTLQIHPKDNVLVALQDLAAGETFEHNSLRITLKDFIPAKHKFAINDLKKGDQVFMYGGIVGKALSTIPSGGVLSIQNVTHQAEDFGKKSGDYQWDAPDISKFRDKTFMGFHRPDGQVGTGNYWLVIPMVFCENRNVDIIKEAFLEELGFGKPNPFKKMVREMASLYKSGQTNSFDSVSVETLVEKTEERLFDNIDGIKFLNHQVGCGGTRTDSQALCALIAGYINNPNVAGATILSLGCQNAQSSFMEEKLRIINPDFKKKLIILEQQVEGTEQQLLTRAIKETFIGMVEANTQTRQPAHLSKLVVGLECGGSDGFSGISANPAVGYAADMVVALGGTAILSEFPELCGVEQELINRCVSDDKAERFSSLMRAYAGAAEAAGSGFDMNPSPGNIKDGLITDAMKSSGAAKKGGTSPVTDVLDYGEYVKTPGLNLLCTPGNDVESTTAMAGAGANMILFTTGLGTPTGNPVTPVIKVSSNHKLTQRMPDIIDINTGFVISGEKNIRQMGEEILEKVIKIASGEEKSKAMILGQDDFIPWKRGVSL
ncbi:altronate dehydratase family protein [Algoriphagus sp. C2-6-M1]|uniref:UxaA family hydrolase n=1 Tax=Algoriphagus persicinus TaxID=3108754 RepID=UPI002B37CB45|nr:altronate dehydratase family protein [Algoriphagus sp. C2-6-M1]MEB2781082.1 altronate dehydratase family protein [Algoriphagus sp. C2-6-M1]